MSWLSSLRVPVVNGMFAALDLALGTKIAAGISVTFGSGKPFIHVQKSEISQTIESLLAQPDKLITCIESYGEVSGFTTSDKGLKVFSAVLDRLIKATGEDTADGKEARKTLKMIRTEALKLDRSERGDPSWLREMECCIGSERIKIAISLKPSTLVHQVAAKCLGMSDSKSLYGYHLTLTPTTPVSALSISLKRSFRQVAEFSCLAAPIVPVAYLIFQTPLNEFMANLSNNPVVQSALVGIARLSAIVATGSASAVLVRFIDRQRQLQRIQKN